MLRGHSYAALSAAFSPDGRQLVTSGVDRTVRLWDVSERGSAKDVWRATKPSCALPPLTPAARASSRPPRTAPPASGTVADGRVLLLLAGHQAPVYAAVYSPDGRYILTAGEDRTARLWDANNGLPVQDFAGHTARVTAAGFSPDGTTVVTASADRTIRLWHCPYHPELRGTARPCWQHQRRGLQPARRPHL